MIDRTETQETPSVCYPIRRAIDAAIADVRKPLADLTPDEVEVLYDRVVYHFIVQNARPGTKVVIRG